MNAAWLVGQLSTLAHWQELGYWENVWFIGVILTLGITVLLIYLGAPLTTLWSTLTVIGVLAFIVLVGLWRAQIHRNKQEVKNG